MTKKQVEALKEELHCQKVHHEVLISDLISMIEDYKARIKWMQSMIKLSKITIEDIEKLLDK